MTLVISTTWVNGLDVSGVDVLWHPSIFRLCYFQHMFTGVGLS